MAVTKKKAASKAKAPATPKPKLTAEQIKASAEAPKTIAMKGGLTAKQLMQETLFTMDDDLRISKHQATDFFVSLQAVVDREISEGNPVNLFGCVKLVPRLHTKGKRLVNKVFGDAESGKITKQYPAKASVKATVLKPVKDALPTASKLMRKVGK